jgi:hypothetical protein
VYKAAFSSKPQPAKQSDEEVSDTLPQADASIVVKLVKSAAKANTVVLSASGLGGKIVSVGYELSYDSQGLIKGVQSGSKPIETAGQDTFEREVYLGTCSKNDCKPDAGVTKVSIVLEFTDTNGKKSQYSKDYDL